MFKEAHKISGVYFFKVEVLSDERNSSTCTYLKFFPATIAGAVGISTKKGFFFLNTLVL